MSEKFLIKPYIDHFIQAQIIKELTLSEQPIRFSDLKEQGMDNSLFMYHANKLLDRGLLEKTEGGFKLTAKGARWANNADVGLLSQELLPRPLIQFIIIKENKILLGKRLGAMKKLLNEYLLPGGLHEYGFTAKENALQLIPNILKGENFNLRFLSVAEYIVSYPDFTHHSIAHIFRVEIDNPEVNDQSDYASEWFNLDEINSSNPDFSNNDLIIEIVKKISDLNSHEVFRIIQANNS